MNLRIQAALPFESHATGKLGYIALVQLRSDTEARRRLDNLQFEIVLTIEA